ncbi:hypothetical protein [Helicobacter sp. MIT 01-3238]|uniref:hypothetical protein n=1 Tax=Helicobacter sp. MIT 01-3238 TaxID=398627 RepID=UPI0011C03F48|nr:hypothetical protein [Helicobacter sp. MIT 01-3238]
MQNQRSMTKDLPTPKPPPQREGALGSFPTSQGICHTTIPRHLKQSKVSQTNFLNCHTAIPCHTGGVARSI